MLQILKWLHGFYFAFRDFQHSPFSLAYMYLSMKENVSHCITLASLLVIRCNCFQFRLLWSGDRRNSHWCPMCWHGDSTTRLWPNTDTQLSSYWRRWCFMLYGYSWSKYVHVLIFILWSNYQLHHSSGNEVQKFGMLKVLNKIREILIYWFSDCSDYELRLIGGTSNLQGRVEICLGNIWGTVCDDRWDNANASVVCGYLGYSRDGTLIIYCKSERSWTASTFLIHTPVNNLCTYTSISVFSFGSQTEFIVDSEECAQGQRHGSKPGISLQLMATGTHRQHQLLPDSWANVRALF